ncbi:MAG: type-F conjugative transfer system pilin assembly thiol-disulfide isomerase TrbB [Hafnia sp.]
MKAPILLLSALVGMGSITGASASSVADELRQLEAHKSMTLSIDVVSNHTTPSVSAPRNNIPEPRSIAVRRDYMLPNGKVVNLNNYKAVLFMQAGCPYCQQFDPLLKSLASQIGLSVFPYTLDGQGDVSFPHAIPAPKSVIDSFYMQQKIVTPAVYLVEVNTMKTLPLLYGAVDGQTLVQRLNEGLMLAEGG